MACVTFAGEIYCLNSKSSAAPSISRRSSLRSCSCIWLLSRRPLIWNALSSVGFSANMGGNNGTLFGLGMVPMGCKCLTISVGRDKSNCAGGSLVWAISWADLDLLATGARFFITAGFFLAAGAFLTGAGFFAGVFCSVLAAGLPSVTGAAASTEPALHRLSRPITTTVRKIEVISPTALTAESHMLAFCAWHDKSGDSPARL